VFGLIGGATYRRLTEEPERYDAYALARRRGPSRRVAGGRAPRVADERLILSDLSDLDQLTEAFSGIDVVVHMAADPDPGGRWESILNSNVIGAYHVFEASRRAAVKRVVFASSGQATLGYQAEEPYRSISEGSYEDLPDPIPLVTHRHPVRPINVYGCSKVWGEALARVYADVHGLSCICLRIGWVVAEDRPPNPAARAVWCSRRDIVQLIERCIDAPESVRFDILYGVSEDRHCWMDIERARQVVGYVPQDRAEDHL
jgi:nucleoside-diphosphate-sugar epimerase